AFEDRQLRIPVRGSPDLIHILHMLYSRMRTCECLHPTYLRKPVTPLICTL
ncbi:hypothetical protein ABG768_021139, partial [Culter alburnus]